MKREKIFILLIFFLASFFPQQIKGAETLPDLSIVGVSFSPRTPSSGESFSGELRVEIANNGLVDTSNPEGIWLTVALSTGWSLVQWGYPRGEFIKNLPAGSRETIIYPINNLTLVGRTVEVRAWIDSGPIITSLPNELVNENLYISESNETNNTVVTELRLSQLRNIIPPTILPDLTLSNLEIQSTDGVPLTRNPKQGETFWITPTLLNSGEGVAFFPFSIDFSQNNQKLGFIDTKQDLQKNVSRKEKNSYNFSFAEPGTYEITFQVNPDQKISESDITNNSKTLSITIDPKPEEPKPMPTEIVNTPDEYTLHAEKLLQNQFTSLREEFGIKENKDVEKDFATRFLDPLLQGDLVPDEVKTALLHFISYGVDMNTWKLGGGERNAVLLSYKDAFGKLPTTTEEFTDVIKIANGRWPKKTSENAIQKAEEDFEKIYKRKANKENTHDNAALTIITYGLRQRAENRNQVSESKAQATFGKIYGHGPSNTNEWNILQAITYSGAKR